MEDSINRTGVIGVMLGNPKHQRKGYGTEAVNLLLDYGFSFLNFRNISLNVFEYNEAAYNLYKKIGFKEVGRLRKAAEILGETYDIIIMDMLREEFQSVYIKRKLEKYSFIYYIFTILRHPHRLFSILFHIFSCQVVNYNNINTNMNIHISNIEYKMP